jgi:hypothetical protein
MIYLTVEESLIVQMEMLLREYGRKEYLKIFYELGYLLMQTIIYKDIIYYKKMMLINFILH